MLWYGDIFKFSISHGDNNKCKNTFYSPKALKLITVILKMCLTGNKVHDLLIYSFIFLLFIYIFICLFVFTHLNNLYSSEVYKQRRQYTFRTHICISIFTACIPLPLFVIGQIVTPKGFNAYHNETFRDGGHIPSSCYVNDCKSL